jgi:eukaryotic-like serine/threonine-protein kinase
LASSTSLSQHTTVDLRTRVQQSPSGSYTVDRELGGGMSRVFVADEPRLGRKVVVKVLSHDLAAAMSATRFGREIRVAASLQQANIVPVLAAGDLDGLPYYTMPFVEGESLRARLGRGPVSITEAVSILRDVARSHTRTSTASHRDIKSDNVLLSGHTAVVTDFGIAKAISAAVGSADRPDDNVPRDLSTAALTVMGTALGTPAYMAPEQAAADPAADHRADKGLAALDAAYRVAALASLPLLRDRSQFLALGYTRLNSAAKARDLLNGYEARLDAFGRRQEFGVLNRVRG